MRIAIGQLSQESNTFNPLPTTRANFENFGVVRGADLLEQMAHTNEPGGFIQALRQWPNQPEIVPLVRFMAWPSGRATADTLAWVREEMTTALRGAGRVDGMLLSLHGAMVSDAAMDVEGEMLRAVREVLGPDVPLVATLDLHANVTQQMIDCATALVLFHTAPHIDVFETGERGARVLERILLEGCRPTMEWRKIPMVVPAERANTQNPQSVSYRYREHVQRLEQDPRFLAAGLATVQPWLDIAELGTSVIIVTDNDRALAEHEADALARDVWAHRRDYLPELTAIDEAVKIAHETPGLVVMSDSADATTSGAPGDSTLVLREMLRYDWSEGALVTLVAPEVVEQARLTGVGNTLLAVLGGRRDAIFSQPLTVRARVERLFDARFTISGHLARNLPINMGASAVLSCGGIRVIVTSRSGPHFAPELFRAAGHDPYRAKLLVAKSPCGFRAAYESSASRVLIARGRGCAASDFWNLPFKQIPRPLWPWDESLDW